jgi:hypothetical protein
MLQSHGDQDSPHPTSPDEYLEKAPIGVVLRMTLLLTLSFPGCQGVMWPFKVVLSIFAIVGLVHPKVMKQAEFWLVLGVANFALQNVYNWEFTDNHVCLYSYWYLAIALSLISPDPAAILALNGRLMIGLVFLFATLQKVLSPAYMSSDAFLFFLLRDRRFFPIAKLVGIRHEEWATLHSSMRELVSPIQVPVNDQLLILATSLTWWTIFIEGLIAATFLFPQVPLARKCSNWAILLFVATTGTVAHVIGFAWILLIMGYAQCPRHYRKTSTAYHCLFGLMIVFSFSQIRALMGRVSPLFTATY